MTNSDVSNVSWLTESRGVVVLQWPDESAEAQRLEGEGVPHLLLVADGAAPPVTGSCFEDWLSLPATDLEIRTRLVGLAKRAAHHSPRPQVDEVGQCTHRGRSVFLSPIDQRLAQMLVEHFGSVVTERELIAHVWPEGATNQALRVHVSRLRQRVEPIGLNITCARGTGYVITETNRDVGSN